MSDDQAAKAASDTVRGGIDGVLNNLRGMTGSPAVAACLTVVAGALATVVLRAVADTLKDPEVRERLAAVMDAVADDGSDAEDRG